jgi:hypothetical protein
MKEENDPVEVLLAKMRPAELNNDLMARLTASRANVVPSKATRGSFLSRLFFPIATVACVAVLTVKFLDGGTKIQSQPPVAATSPETANKQLPVVVQDHLMHARDMGVVVGPNRQPYRVMEYQWVESDTIVPGKNAPAVRLETTRRHIVPVEIEIY